MSLFAFDPSHDRYAIAFRDGEVLIKKSGQEDSLLGLSHYLGKYKDGTGDEVAALSFSPNGQLLARIQGKVLTVWVVTVLSGKTQLEHDISNGRLIAFDQSSKMLFVGTVNGVEVWGVKDGRLLGEYTTPGITSLSVSLDNRLLIWGDKSGAIHVWGLRK
jgi:WD40 repeat protein